MKLKVHELSRTFLPRVFCKATQYFGTVNKIKLEVRLVEKLREISRDQTNEIMLQNMSPECSMS